MVGLVAEVEEGRRGSGVGRVGAREERIRGQHEDLLEFLGRCSDGWWFFSVFLLWLAASERVVAEIGLGREVVVEVWCWCEWLLIKEG